MPADGVFQSWIKTKRNTKPPCDLTDRIMIAIQERPHRSRSSALRDRMISLAVSRKGRVAVCFLAGAACLFRLRQVVSVFLE